MRTLAGLTALMILLTAVVASGQDSYPTLSQLSYDYYGAGARAFAMGNAFVGLADDVSGGTWNPAGIWAVEYPTVAASYLYFVPADRYTHSLTPVATENALDVNTLGSFCFAVPFRVKGHPWVFDFNYVRNNEFIIETSYFSGDTSVPAMNPDVFEANEGHLKSFRFGVTTRLYKQLSFGFTANVYDGRLLSTAERKYAWVVDNPIGYADDYHELNATRVDSTTSNGLNFTVGLMYNLEKYRLGAVVHTPFVMKHSSDLRIDYAATKNGLPYSSGTESVLVNDSIAKQDMPLTLALGAAALLTDKLTLTLDLNYQHYEDLYWHFCYLWNINASGDRTDYYRKYQLDWNNTLGVGCGAEYNLDTKFGRVPLRAGLRYDQLPQPKEFDFVTTAVYDDLGEVVGTVTSYTASGRQNAMSFSLGTGVHWSWIKLDFAYRYTGGAEIDVDSYIYSTLYANQRLERKAHEFRGTFTGHF